MLVEDGRRLLISNLELEHLTRNVGSALDGGGESGRALYSRSAYQFFHLFPEANRFRLSTAARMSATFPFISPAVSLPTRPPRRVVDAGYYDNYGVNAAAMWIFHHREWIRQNAAGIVLIQIRAFPTTAPRRSGGPIARRPEGDRTMLNGLRFLTGPAQGLLQARRAVMSYRNDEQLELLSDYFCDHDGRPGFFQAVSFECPASASLSWHITRLERQAILDSFEPDGGGEDDPSRENLARLDALKSWWAASAASASEAARPATEPAYA